MKCEFCNQEFSDTVFPHHLERCEKAHGKDEMLLGSSIQPSLFKLKDNSELQLGDIVLRAFQNSGKKESEWNGLDDEERESLIQSEIDKLELAEPSLSEYERLKKTADELGIRYSGNVSKKELKKLIEGAQ